MKQYDYTNHLASKWQRFGNLFIDILTIYLLSYVAGLVFAVLFLIVLGIRVTGAYGSTIMNLLFITLALMLVFFYYAFLEYKTGRTLGKLITGTSVINKMGFRPSFKEVIIRTLCRFIPLEAFSFLWNGDFHDKFSKTLVI